MKAGKVDGKAVSVIWESPPFPDYQWTVRGDVDAAYGAGFTEKLQGGADRHNRPGDPPKPFGRSKFIPVTNAAYEPLIEVGRSTGSPGLTMPEPAIRLVNASAAYERGGRCCGHRSDRRGGQSVSR